MKSRGATGGTSRGGAGLTTGRGALGGTNLSAPELIRASEFRHDASAETGISEPRGTRPSVRPIALASTSECNVTPARNTMPSVVDFAIATSPPHTGESRDVHQEGRNVAAPEAAPLRDRRTLPPQATEFH